MDSIAWHPTLATYDPQIDSQHRRTFELAAALDATCRECPAEHPGVASAAYTLSEHLLEHFRTQEALMEQLGYPEIARHRLLHASASREVLAVMAAAMSNPGAAPGALVGLVTDWLTSHILAEDIRVAVYAKLMTE